jgi:hypothetical protein
MRTKGWLLSTGSQYKHVTRVAPTSHTTPAFPITRQAATVEGRAPDQLACKQDHRPACPPLQILCELRQFNVTDVDPKMYREPFYISSRSYRRPISTCPSSPDLLDVCPGVLDLCNQNIAGSSLSELVHDNGNLLPRHHDRDGDPAALLERSDGGCAVSGCNPAGIVELRALDVVCAEDVLLRSCLMLAC